MGPPDPRRKGGAVAVLVIGAGHEGLGNSGGTLFCLTPGEARLAKCLGEGLSLREAAAEFGVSVNTVRMQLRHVFAKTGTRRQLDLVRLILGS